MLRAQHQWLASPQLAAAVATLPAAAPGIVAPIASAPAAELGAVDGAAFAKFKHALPTVWTAGIDAQGLNVPRVGVHAKCTVPHTKEAILAGQFPQAVRDVHVPPPRAVLSAQDHVLTRVALPRLGRQRSWQKCEG